MAHTSIKLTVILSAAAARYWRYQQQDYDCAEMAVADVVGEITGRLPSEDDVTTAAANIPSVSHPGPIYRPSGKTRNQDMPVLLAHYGIAATGVHTSIEALTRVLDRGQKIIVGLNDSGIEGGRDEQVPLAAFEAAWTTSDNFAVVTR